VIGQVCLFVCWLVGLFVRDTGCDLLKSKKVQFHEI